MAKSSDAGIAVISLEELKNGNADEWASVCEHFKFGLVAKANQMLRFNRIAKKIGSEDIVQETYLKAWRSRSTFRGHTLAEFASWLFCILKSTFLDFCRRTNLEYTIHSWFDFSGGEDTPSRMLVSSESEALLHCALAQIDPISQKVIVLRHFEQFKFARIAKTLGMNPNSVASIYRRGIEKLHKTMDSEHTA